MNQAKKQNLSACFMLKNMTEYFPLSLILQSVILQSIDPSILDALIVE